MQVDSLIITIKANIPRHLQLLPILYTKELLQPNHPHEDEAKYSRMLRCARAQLKFPPSPLASVSPDPWQDLSLLVDPSFSRAVAPVMDAQNNTRKHLSPARLQRRLGQGGLISSSVGAIEAVRVIRRELAFESGGSVLMMVRDKQVRTPSERSHTSQLPLMASSGSLADFAERIRA